MVAGRIYHGDFSKGANLMGNLSAGAALAEFIVNPTLGKWSDAHGRKKLLLLGPGGLAVISVLYVILPESQKTLALTLAWSVGNAVNALSGSTFTITSLTDICA